MLLSRRDEKNIFFSKTALPYSLESKADFTKFKEAIPFDAVVYWEGNGAVYTWFLLNRSNYISETQTAGTVFNKGTAFEGARRAQHVSSISERDAVSSANWLKGINGWDVPTIVTKPNLMKVCNDPILKFVVLSEPVPQLAYVTYASTPNSSKTYYLYKCAAVLKTN
jgi:hypothetical protein